MTGRVVEGVVRSWVEEEGWGVLDSPATPGGCWVHWSVVLVDGHRSLVPGSRVSFESEVAAQDGFAHRALRAWPAGRQPASAVPSAGDDHDGSAYASTLVISFDAPLDAATAVQRAAGGTVPPGAAAVRAGAPADLPEVERLWAATFPALPVPDLAAAVSGTSEVSTVLVLAALPGAGAGEDGGPLTGAALVSAVDGAPQERRLTVLADRPDRWSATEGAAAAHLRHEGVRRWHVTVREDAEGSVRQLEVAGYELTSRSWGATLRANLRLGYEVEPAWLTWTGR